MSGSTNNSRCLGPGLGWMAPAREADAGEVLALYRSLIGTPGATWNEYYPGPEDVAADIARGSLWCLRGEDGTLWGAASAGEDDADIRALDCWTPAQSSCELSRVGVRLSLQGKGLARAMVRFLMEESARQGRDWMRLLVSRDNPGALRVYQRMGFADVGSCEMYGVCWRCQEKRLG